MNTDQPLIAHINLARGFRGGERQTLLIIRELDARGWRQRLVARRGEPLAERCREFANVDLVEVSSSVFSAARACKGADLIHVHHGRSLQAGFLAWLFYRIPYLVTRRVENRVSPNALNRKMYRSAAAIAVLSRAIARSLNGTWPGEYHVIPSAKGDLPVDEKLANEIRASYTEKYLVGHAGALEDAAKGQLQIIATARELARRGRDIGFVLMGSGPDEAMLKEAAADLDNVHFTGQVRSVGSYLSAFDFFMFPSRFEGLGSSLLDALDFGLPIVATNAGGIPEIVLDGERGFLCEVDDIDCMVASFEKLLDDPELAQRIAAHNRQEAEIYSSANMAERYLSIYDDILNRKGLSS